MELSGDRFEIDGPVALFSNPSAETLSVSCGLTAQVHAVSPERGTE